MIELERDFQPNWISPPGNTIADVMEERDWNQVELAKRLGMTTKHLNQLIKGKASLTEETALKLERVLGSTARFWLNREASYRVRLAKREEQMKYEIWTDWLDVLPIAWLKQVNAIPDWPIIKPRKPEIVETLLKFFGVASPQEWEDRYKALHLTFRRTCVIESEIGAVTSWLRVGEILAEKTTVPKYSRARFSKALNEIRELTVLPPGDFEPKLQALCNESGVKLAFVPAPPNAHVSGVARWLNLHSPIIQLSLYGKTNDQFWFAFFHEAAHILLHADSKESIFLDDWGGDSGESRQEQEASQWAAEMLIPNSDFSDSFTKRITSSQVRQFAQSINIHPGIVVGRLQHEGKLQSTTTLNRLKDRFEIDSVVFYR